MQSQEDIITALPMSNHLPHHSSRPSVNGELAGFSQSAFHQNKASMGGYRERQFAQMPSINTGRSMQNPQTPADIQTPNYDMNYTPLLPSQLLMGSPFQPGSPAAFASPQFPSFANGHQSTHNHITSPLALQDPNSPTAYQTMMSSAGMGTNGFSPGAYGNANNAYAMHMSPGMVSSTSRTVYLGNIPPDTPAEEILSHVRSGQIESVRLLPDKNCAFVSFLDSSSAVHFHSDAILKKLNIKGQDIKIGWGKPSTVPTSVTIAVQHSGASRNVYLGQLPADTTEEELREDLGKFGPIDTVKLVREKNIAFVHFLSITHAIRAVAQLPQEPKWQPPRKVFYGKDRCAYVSKTQQQNAAQYLGIAPGYAHVLNSADRDVISNALAQQSVAAAAVATAAGGVNNLGNRTVYLGNIHPETTGEEICNVVRGGLLHHIRYIADKHICFVTFIDPTSAASFYALSQLQGLMIHNRRLKIGWGKHSGALPPAIALAVSGGASRNVYIGNIDQDWSEDRLRQDFSEYGDIELINTLREKSCAFVNFTNIANAIKAIEGIRGKEEYKRFKINFGKDRCGNPPRQVMGNNGQNNQMQNQANGQDTTSPPPTMNGNSHHRGSHSISPANHMSHGHRGSLMNGSMHGPSPSTVINSGNNNPLSLYLDQLSLQPQQQSGPQHNQHSMHGFDQESPSLQLNSQPNGLSSGAQTSYFGSASSPSGASSFSNGGLQPPQQSHHHFSNHGSSNSFSNAFSSGAPTIGGLLAPSTATSKSQHARALSMPAFSQGPFGQAQSNPSNSMNSGFGGLGSGLGSFGSNGLGSSHFGLAIQDSALPRWAEEEVGS